MGTKITIGAVLAGLTWFLGGWDTGLEILTIFVVLDYATGILSAFVRKELNSDVGLKGIAKKVSIFLLVGFATAVDHYVGGTFIRSAVIGFMLANEGLSILENFGKLGIPIPSVLKNALETLGTKAEPPTPPGPSSGPTPPEGGSKP